MKITLFSIALILIALVAGLLIVSVWIAPEKFKGIVSGNGEFNLIKNVENYYPNSQKTIFR